MAAIASSGVRPLLLAAALWWIGPLAWASAGSQFSSQVQAHLDAMARSEVVAGQTARLCAGLDAGPAMNDARCVAWRLHQRQRADRSRAAACEAGGEGSAFAYLARCVLGGLTDSAA